MKAVILRNTGGVDQLVVEEIAKPEIKSDEILVRTKAASINPIEIKTRKGNRFSDKLFENPPSILGWDASGMVEKTGKDVDEFQSGDKVFGIIGFPSFGKTYAEYFVARAEHLCKIPKNVDFDKAAASTIAAITAFQALKDYGKVQSGTRILIHAASGGVGHFGVQIAKYFGAEIWATASAEKQKFVEQLGVDHFIDYKTEDFEDHAREMDLVFDLIGGDYIDRSLKTLKNNGMIISIPSATNAEVEKKAEAKGCTGIRFSLKQNKKDLQEIAHLLESGHLKPFISERFPIDQIREAHTELEKGHVKGKIVITMNQ